MKITIAVPSLRRDSLSIRVLKRLPPPNSFNKETTATGSVAQMTEPNIKETYQSQLPNPIPRYFIPMAIAALIQIATIIPGTAIKKAFQKDFLKVWTSKSNAASKIKVGRKTYNIISGLIWPAQKIEFLSNFIFSIHSKRSKTPKNSPIISSITVNGIGIFFKNFLVKIPINRLAIIKNNGDISRGCCFSIISSPAHSPAKNKNGEKIKIIVKIFFM